jgi:hypothetical protein
MGVDICFLIFHGFSARMILQSEVIPLLKQEGLSIAVIAPNADEEGMKETAKSLRIAVYKAPHLESFTAGEYAVLRSYIFEDIRHNPALWSKHIRRLKIREGRNPWRWIGPYIYYWIHLLAQRLPIIRKLFQKFEHSILFNTKAAELLDKINPGLVVSTYPINFSEATFMRVAQRQGRKTVIELLSWDNITSKGHFPTLADYFISWGPIMTQEVKEYYGFPTDRIFEVGVPHFDKHINIPTPQANAEHLKSLALDPKKPYLFFGMSAPIYCPHEIDIVEWIAQEVNKGTFGDVQFVVRLHPQNVHNYTADNMWLLRLEKMKSERVAVDYPILEQSQLLWNMHQYDLVKLVNLIAGCAVSLNSGSTLAVESLIHNKPIILPCFDAGFDVPWYKSIVRCANYIHIQKFLELGGTKVVHSFDELKSQIQDALANPSLEGDKRKYALGQECGICDGKASFRAAEALVKISGGSFSVFTYEKVTHG